MQTQSLNFRSSVPFSGRSYARNNFSNPIEYEEDRSGFSKKTLCAAVVASSIAAASLAGFFMHKNSAGVIKKLKSEKQALKDLLKEAENTVPAKSNIEEAETRIGESLKDKTIDYDPMAPAITGKKVWNPNEYRFDYDKIQPGTNLRTGRTALDVPEIDSDGFFDFTVPKTEETVITKVEPTHFEPQKNVQTGISENYADSVVWDNDKISRDIMQNFFDGHGQTLDGVQIQFNPTRDGKYRVRIEGASTYSPDKAAYIGESSKRDNANAAGNYGEGLKMATLKLLRDKGAKNVRIGSNDWELNYKLGKGNLSDARVLSYDLERVPEKDGNFLEFETDDKKLLGSLRQTVNRFYHSGNPDFFKPDFENEHFGIKILPKNQAGGIYIAGQKFEYNGDYDGLAGATIFIKEKPPKDVLDPSRDRTSLNKSQLTDIAGWLAKNKTDRGDKLKLIKVLEPYGEAVKKSEETSMHSFTQRFVNDSYWGSNDLDGKINFPEKSIALSSASPDVIADLKNNGYKIFSSEYNNLGMRDIHDFYGDARSHTAYIPNEEETKKILLLKEGIKTLSKGLKDKHFSGTELDPKIYLFDAKGPGEKSMYSTALAEAIVDNGTSKGFWIDRDYLKKADFGEVLETSLHELSHKAGGDETSRFSYKLTDVNAESLKEIFKDEKTRDDLIAINNLWKQ